MSEAQQDLNLGLFLRELWAAKVFLFCGVLVGVVAAFCVATLSVPQYQARMMIGPAQQIDVSGQGGASDYNQGAPSVQGQGNMQTAHRFTSFEAIYSGASVARLLLRDERVGNGLSQDKAFRFGDARNDWNAAYLAEYIGKRVWLDSFGETELRSLNYRHPDPVFAAYFVQQIHRTADQIIRADLRDGVDQRIAYLERAIAKTLNPEHRRAITGLLLEQERARMVVSMDEPVAAKVIEQASALPKAVWPDALLLLFGFAALGAFLGYVVFGVRRTSSQYE